jgi:dienelactone hydrolase
MTSSTQPNAPSAIDFAIAAADEPLGLSLAARDCPQGFSGAAAHRIEFSSRGDRVVGRLLLPETRSGPCPLIVALGAAGEGCDSESFDFLASLVRDGFAIATLDLSLHGERKSAKFSERLLAAIADCANAGKLDANGEALLIEFTRQSVADASRTLDALTALPAIDAERVGLIGIGHGAALAAIAASGDVRAKCVVLANCGTVAVPAIDPREFVPAIRPREVLELDAEETANQGTILDFLAKCLSAA